MVILKEQIADGKFRKVYRFDNEYLLMRYATEYIKKEDIKFYKYETQLTWFENIWGKLTVPKYIKQKDTEY